MKQLKSIGFAALYLVIPFAVQIIISIELTVQILLIRGKGIQVPASVINKFQDDYGYNLILVTLMNLVLIAGMGLWYSFIRRKQEQGRTNVRKIVSLPSVACLAALAFCTQFACNIIMGVFAAAFPDIYKNYTELIKGVDINVLPVWATLFIVVVWAPLAEEIVFRAMIFRTLRKGFALIPAAALSGAAFGIYHMNWVQGVYAGVLGFLLALIYDKTNSLLGSYLFHFLFNFMNYGISFVEEYAGIPELLFGLGTLVLTVLSIPGTFLFMRVYMRMFSGEKEQV